MIIKTFDELVELSLKINESTEFECDFNVMVDGILSHCYMATVAPRDIIVDFDAGTANYLVDSYGDDHKAELFDWEFDTDFNY